MSTDTVPVAGDAVSCGPVWVSPSELCEVRLRGERIRMSVASPASGPGVAGRITKVADLGFVTHYFVRLADRQDALVYRLGDGAMVADRLEEGQQVHLTWDTADARLFPERTDA